MTMDFPLEQTVKTRHSVRTYDNQPLTPDEAAKISEYVKNITNPFGIDISFHFLKSSLIFQNAHLGTYGVIKGAKSFIGASVLPQTLALEALGYSFEKLILYIASLGLDTCWLGGSFHRSEFMSAMQVNQTEIFPIVSPIGHAREKKRILESLTRRAIKAESRRNWNELFFNRDFQTSLTKEDAGIFAFALDMLRLAPSAVNRQPWRIVKDQDTFHFYEARSLPDNKIGIDIQRIDMGIGACHFHLAALKSNLAGTFTVLSTPTIHVQDNVHYLFSWVMDPSHI